MDGAAVGSSVGAEDGNVVNAKDDRSDGAMDGELEESNLSPKVSAAGAEESPLAVRDTITVTTASTKRQTRLAPMSLGGHFFSPPSSTEIPRSTSVTLLTLRVSMPLLTVVSDLVSKAAVLGS
jgi:hypothetical protein